MRKIGFLFLLLLCGCSEEVAKEREAAPQAQEAIAVTERPYLEVSGMWVDPANVLTEIPIENVHGVENTKSIQQLLDDEKYIKGVYGTLFEANNEAELKDIIEHTLSTLDIRVGIYYTGEVDPYEPYFNALVEIVNTQNMIGGTFLGYNQAIEKLDNGYMMDIHNFFTTNNIELVTLNNMLDELMTTIPLEGKTEMQQVEQLYKTVMAGIDYVETDSITDYSPAGFLYYGEGVCQAYAVTLMMLLDRIGIENRYIVGEVETESGIEYHAWNMVKLHNSWYHLDATWDDGLYLDDPLMWQYFLVSDEMMAQSRTWERRYYEQAVENYGEN